MTEFLQIILLWLIIILNKTGYYLYLWQVKEYRFDRMVAGLKEPGGFSAIFSKVFYSNIFLLLTFILFENTIFVRLLLSLYVFESALFIYQIAKRQNRVPKTTAKSIAIFFLSVISVIAIFLFAIIDFSPYVFLLTIDILLFFIVTFWTLMLKPLSFLGKQIIVYRAKQKRKGMKGLIAVGVTGSFGKTSVKEFLATILSKKFRIAKTREHQNTEIGAARAILLMPYGTQVLIAEEAAYRKGDIKEISEVVGPAIGIITGIGSQHLALFGSQEAIVETKFELAQALPKNGTLIVNWDSECVRIKSKELRIKNVKKYSIKERDTDLYASDIDETLEGSFFTIHHKNKSVRAETSLLGRHNVSNVLAASVAALELGMSLEEVAKAIADIKPFPRTLEPKRGIKNSLIIDDTYNASFEGVLGALDVLSLAKGKKILVFTSIIELGDAAKDIHKQIGKRISEVADVAIIVDKKYAKELQSQKTIWMNDPDKIRERIAREAVARETVVLLEGRIPRTIIRAIVKN